MKVIYLYASLLCVVTEWYKWGQMCREHGEVGEGIAGDILLDAKVRGEGAKNRPDLSSNWFILLLFCKGHKWFVCAK